MEFLNKIILRGITGAGKNNCFHEKTVATFPLLTEYCTRDKDGVPVLDLMWWEITAWEGRDITRKTLEALDKNLFVEVTGRVRLRKYTNEKNEERIVPSVIAREVKIIGAANNVQTSVQTSAPGVREAEILYKRFRDDLRNELVSALAKRIDKTGTGRLIFQEPAERNHECAVYIRFDSMHGEYEDYMVIAAENRGTPESPQLFLICWSMNTGRVSDYEIETLEAKVKEVLVDDLLDLDTFLTSTENATDVTLDGDRYVYKDKSGLSPAVI